MKNTGASKSYRDMTDADREAIILYWRTHRENSAVVIAKEFGYSAGAVNRVLDNFLSNKY
jgi:hypothetical protein